MEINNKLKQCNLNILNILGSGTYGNVYLCERINDGKLTVIKCILFNTKIKGREQDNTNEVKILASLKHPNIIKFYDCFYLENSVMISMEYADKGNLADYMYQLYPQLLSQQEILFYFCQIILGVNYIHSYDIIHRDLKAENILLTGKRGVIAKIGDFGISKMLASAKKTSTIIGTPYYLAPELCDGKPYDTKSDVWALGCLLYEMCTHKRAFEAETLVGLIKVITGGSVHPINLSLYERGIQDLIDSMLSILPEKRPTIKQVMMKLVILPILYAVYLDAGNDDFLYKTYCGLKEKNDFPGKTKQNQGHAIINTN